MKSVGRPWRKPTEDEVENALRWENTEDWLPLFGILGCCALIGIGLYVLAVAYGSLAATEIWLALATALVVVQLVWWRRTLNFWSMFAYTQLVASVAALLNLR